MNRIRRLLLVASVAALMGGALSANAQTSTPGERDGRPVIKVLVAELTPALAESLPEELEGYAVEVEETGEIRALD